MNLFTQLVYLRGILYFGLGIECLIWYYEALNDSVLIDYFREVLIPTAGFVARPFVPKEIADLLVP